MSDDEFRNQDSDLTIRMVALYLQDVVDERNNDKAVGRREAQTPEQSSPPRAGARLHFGATSVASRQSTLLRQRALLEPDR
jgi:hypothetical protein